ncbi:MAG: succinate dehydrogenase, cytochrome b556 subunit [Pseudomonadales bacterium]
MKSNRPVYLNLLQFSWPFAALASITHRITGAVLFFALLGLLYALDLGLSSPTGFAEAKALLAMPLSKFMLWLVLAAITYHLVAGIKHMLLDFHIGDTVAAAKLGSVAVFAISAVIALGLGVWIW